MSSIQLEIDAQGVARVRIHRPEKRNALSFAALKALIRIAKQLQADRSIRAVIIYGHAQVFSAGIDLSELKHPQQRCYALWQLIQPRQSLFQRACLIWQQLPVPVIAAIEGYCFGAGLQLALACDYRIGHPMSQYSIMESRWGLLPDMGIGKSLADVVGIDQAKDLAFSARTIDAEHALQIGLISRLADDPVLAAQQLAEEYAQRSPDALMAVKQLFNALQQRDKNVLSLEKRWQLRLILGKNSAIARAPALATGRKFLARQHRLFRTFLF
jgi:enoyl-CoA hydratase/carnithine racemase